MEVVVILGQVLLRTVSYHTIKPKPLNLADRCKDGFDGADKVFLLEFAMPMDGTKGFK